MTQPDFDRAREYALRRLQRELSPQMVYHSAWHTESDVVPAAERLAALEGVTGDDLMLLRTAAWYHDIGCVVQRAQHEAIGIGIATTILSHFGYTDAQLKVIAGLIMATRLPQSPHSLLEQILADADLDALGREDYHARQTALRAEWAATVQATTLAEWLQIQITFLSSHRYFTGVARSLRDAGKQKHITELRAQLASLQQTQ